MLISITFILNLLSSLDPFTALTSLVDLVTGRASCLSKGLHQ